jgi:hypothetical protein
MRTAGNVGGGYGEVRIADAGENFFYRLFVGVAFIITGRAIACGKGIRTLEVG